MARGRKPRVDVDQRLADLDAAMLVCRAVGHSMDFVPPGNARRAELRKLGQAELFQRCSRGCGYERRGTYDVATGQPTNVSTKYTKPEYLLPAGSGRVPRAAGRVALFDRYG